jgi:hypothetical protein
MNPLHGKEHAADISKLPPAICLDVIVDDTIGECVVERDGFEEMREVKEVWLWKNAE